MLKGLATGVLAQGPCERLLSQPRSLRMPILYASRQRSVFRAAPDQPNALVFSTVLRDSR